MEGTNQSATFAGANNDFIHFTVCFMNYGINFVHSLKLIRRSEPN